MTPLPKRYGFKLPLEALGGVCVRVSLEFPDKLEYRAAFNGSINMLGKWFQWDHTQEDYQDIPELNVEVAQVWSEVLAAATWEECVEFCARMIECILNDADVQATLSEFVNQHPGGTTYPKETELPPEVTEGNLTISNPTCDPDILWAQCIGFVQTANRMVIDFLETWETYTSSVETIPAIILSIPFLGEVADVLGIDGIAQYANAIIDSIREGYDGDYTLEYENALACEIFCASKDSCVVSLDQLVEIMNDRISGQLTLTNGLELMLSLIDADISGINVADLYLAAFFNMLKLANLVLPITWGIESYLRVTRTFNTPSDDWEILCVECPPEPVGDCESLLEVEGPWYAADGSFAPNSSYGIWIEGEGGAPNQDTANFFWAHTGFPEGTVINQVTYKWSTAVTDVFTYREGGIGGASYSGAATTEVVFNAATNPELFPLTMDTWRLAVTFTDANHAPSIGVRLVEVCFEFAEPLAPIVWKPLYPFPDRFGVIGTNTATAVSAFSGFSDGQHRIWIAKSDDSAFTVATISVSANANLPEWYDASNTQHLTPIAPGDEVVSINYSGDIGTFTLQLTIEP